MKTLQLVCAGAISLSILPLLAVQAEAATLLIDDYESGSVSAITTANTGTAGATVGFGPVATTPQGLTRSGSLVKTLGGAAANRRASLLIDGSGVTTLNIANDSGTNSTTTVTYGNLGALSLAGYDTFRFQVQNTDLGAGSSISIALTINGITVTDTVTEIVSGGTPTEFFEFSFASFGIDPLSPPAINQLSYLISGAISYDLELESFFLAKTAPEPATMLATGLAFGLGTQLLKRKKGSNKG